MSEPVVIAIFNTLPEAHIAQGMLDANGIPSILNNEIFSTLYPIGFNAIGGIPLLVRPEDREAALTLLHLDNDPPFNS